MTSVYICVRSLCNVCPTVCCCCCWCYGWWWWWVSDMALTSLVSGQWSRSVGQWLTLLLLFAMLLDADWPVSPTHLTRYADRSANTSVIIVMPSQLEPLLSQHSNANSCPIWRRAELCVDLKLVYWHLTTPATHSYSPETVWRCPHTCPHWIVVILFRQLTVFGQFRCLLVVSSHVTRSHVCRSQYTVL